MDNEYCSIKQPDYISVADGAARSFGGSQTWLAGSAPSVARCGCGAVAAADLFLYLSRTRPALETPLCLSLTRCGTPTRELYAEYLTEVARRYARPIPGLGLTGFGLARGVNRYFEDNRLPLRASWRQRALEPDALGLIRSQLERDVPVIMSIPPFPLKIKFLRMDTRRPAEGQPRPAYRYRARTGHFVTVCAAHRDVLEVSSWGRRYFIKTDEYLSAARLPAGLLACGCLLLRGAGL